ncbi:TraB/GumN family protein [Parasphingorhabdus sp. DH2-15]|uniref:TraB/GumN family protein n=1 Tax=Parasphingorhabdus sp. DH2-15 TaxID=3444112 RepID=UPI003F684CE2
MTFKFHKTSLFALSMALSSFAFASTAPAMAQQTETPPAATETVDIDPALWVLKDEDTTIYLFGTVHVLKPGLSWFDEAVKDAFDSSDELILEVVEPDQTEMQKLVFSLAVDSENPLRSKLNPEQQGIYDNAMTSLGLPGNAFDQFEPWFAGINLGILPLLKAGYDVNSGAEKVLALEAKAAGKTIGQLETVEQQLGYFDGLPEKSQVEFLIDSAAAVDDTTTQIDTMVDFWGSANVKKLGDFLHASLSDEAIYDALLTKRNANWVEWIKTRMDKPGTVFIAVGAGHLAGKDSVQAMLSANDLKATRIEY